MEELADLLTDWRLHLQASGKQPRTVESYLSVGEQYAAYLRTLGATSVPAGHKPVQHYLVHLQTRSNRRTGKPLSAAEVSKHYRTLQQFYRWLVDVEDLLDANPFLKLQAPKVPEKPVPVIPEEDSRDLLTSVHGTSFYDRRDEALIRLFHDAGPRCAEVVGITVDQVDFTRRVVWVVGKGGRPRQVPFGVKTGEALRRYLRARNKHPRADNPALFLGRRGALTTSGVRQIFRRRGGANPHRYRHTFAHQWLASGGQETDLMRITGWKSRAMVGRYGASAADERARSAHSRAGLGDRF